MKKPNGFTLIEILIVLLIISIVTGVAMVSIHHNENKKAEAFANELTQLLTLTEQQALLKMMVLGMVFQEESFQFETYAQTKTGEPQWIKLNDKILKPYTIPSNISFELKINQAKKDDDDEEEEHKNPQIVFSTNGDLTPFTIRIGLKGKSPRFAIIGEADGSITTKNL